jgi:hypothetical protein
VKNKKSSEAKAEEDFLFFKKRKLFFFVRCFDAAGADSGFRAVNFFALQIDLKFSQGFDIGMAHSVTRSWTASANFTYSTHKI